jgi:hypothetical protein
MLRIEEQSSLKGFGNGQLRGELYYSLNMAPTPFGFAPFYKNTTDTNSNILSGLLRMKWFTEENSFMWGIAETGKIYSRVTSSWALEHTTVVASSGNGLIVDQTGRMLAIHDRYLSKKDATGTGSSWTETWKDFGTTVTGEKGMDTYQDWVVIPHGNVVGLLNVTDNSFNAAAFTLPTGCTALVAKSNKTGVLIGVNMGSRSFIFLWDAQSDRAITDWIWFDSPLKSICRAGATQWMVTTAHSIVLTDGYTIKEQVPICDPIISNTLYNPSVAGTAMINGKFCLAHTDINVQYGRRKSGLYMLDLSTNLWNFVAASDKAVQNVTMGAIFQDSLSQVWISHYNVQLSTYVISKLTNDIPSSAYFITAPFGQGGNRKVAEGAKVELVANNQLQSYLPMSGDISVKVYDFTRPLWTFATQSGTATALNQVNVNGTSGGSNNALAGDEVTILNGVNAGLVRHITSITNQGLSTETWTLDSDLPSLTEDTIFMNVSPFKLVNTFSLASVASIPVDGLYYDIKNRYKGKKFLLKVLFENLSNLPVTVPATTFIYNDTGII